MSLKTILLICFVFVSMQIFGQDEAYLQSFILPTELRENANAIIRFEDTNIDVKAYNKMIYTNKRIVTILNSSGDSKHGAQVGYDENINIKKMEVKIYNSLGKEIKKFRKGDFEDVSAVDGGTLYSDSRVKYLNYTPTDYPYTVLFETEVEYSSTGFLPGWYPIEGFYTSTQNSNYKITNSSGVEVKIKIDNFDNYAIEKLSDFNYSVKNLNAIKPESYSPPFTTFAPVLKASLTEFEMEGVKGVNNTWSDFGKWMNDKLIQDTQVLPQHVKDEIRTRTASAKTNLEKAKIVYEYMQNKTRYISVQVGIGGWKPMLASDVDRLGYGDCKGLTNYTKAMLDEIGVENFYTVIYSGRDIRHMDDSFSSIEGDHVILCLPNESDYLWLECTSQTSPFGYNANFTDDRDALIITPEGGKIVHTKIYSAEENLLTSNATITLDELGTMNADIVSKSYGTQYGHHEGIQNQTEKDQKLYFKKYWSYINALEINALAYNNDKDKIEFTETFKVSAERYASKTGDRLLLQPNFFNRIESAPNRYSNRTLPFEIDRGFTDIDTYEINIPLTLEVEAFMEPVSIKNKFGEYEASITKTDDNKLTYKRKFMVNKGSYAKEEYENYRAFWLEVVKYDKSKIVLKSKS